MSQYHVTDIDHQCSLCDLRIELLSNLESHNESHHRLHLARTHKEDNSTKITDQTLYVATDSLDVIVHLARNLLKNQI